MDGRSRALSRTPVARFEPPRGKQVVVDRVPSVSYTPIDVVYDVESGSFRTASLPTLSVASELLSSGER
jgi:hypothetical protein